MRPYFFGTNCRYTKKISKCFPPQTKVSTKQNTYCNISMDIHVIFVIYIMFALT